MILLISKRTGYSGLLARLGIPIFVLIVTFIALFAAAASYILIRVQNEHNLKLAEQSMKFVDRNIEYQFDTMNNMAAFIMSNQSIENLLEKTHPQPFDAVDDFYTLQMNLQNLSLLSLLNNFGPLSVAQQSYVVAVALAPGSGLYTMASDHFDPSTGIFKEADLKNEEWFQQLQHGERQTVWWAQNTDTLHAPMIYSARKKTSIKDGRTIGTVIVGADKRSMQGVFDNAPLEKGYHLLLDEKNQVIYSERYAFLENAGALPFVDSLAGSNASVVTKIDGENHRVMSEALGNGWKLLAVVPESHFSRYTFAISAIAVATALIALLVAGIWLRSIVVRVTVPISRLVGAIQRPGVVERKEPFVYRNTGIYEVDELNEKFASMLKTIHDLIEQSFKEELERRELRLELLHAQINPHFLYNTLDLINCRAIMAGDRETSRIVRSLANVFRYGLNQGQTWITLEDELKQVEAYLHIQKMLMNDLHVEIHVPDSCLSAKVVHLTLQPLAENAIIHGFAGQRSDCRIVISARKEGTELVLRVKDNGRGCDAERMNRMLGQQPESDTGGKLIVATGYGTMNVHRRIQLHCGEAFGLRYVHAVKGTCVEVVLPYSQAVREAAGQRRGTDV
ncbi:sensor histidine kinase [Paenibacillus sp. OAS669]|uniref:cache domain-containing sensor histidine kinase n=1 Tax=Paenibacillus sp. OAS669 TaxID=2663821 RepID=UPI00178BFDDB|nr:sensor histidine kinase [Paenibacillus sp. OAS669]MBE1440972.1 two-component system sensor histidine kinase YesM [Paenibacillus sp. OAS669]